MTSSPAFAANPSHTITLTPEPARVRVLFKGMQIADTARAIRLQEASYPVCLYIPRADCRMEYFVESQQQTKCPFKGTARYWSLKTPDAEAKDAVWGYDNPFDQMAAIDQHVAFYPQHVEIIKS
jgi:uncharacterized protein (DUF427 family)